MKTRSMRIGKAPGFKFISLKGHQIWENQFHELNTQFKVIYKELNTYYVCFLRRAYEKSGVTWSCESLSGRSLRGGLRNERDKPL